MNINELSVNDMLKRSLKILREMLEDRGEDIRYLDNITEEELIKYYEENSIFDFRINDNLKVIYHMNNKVKINDIRKYINIEEDGGKKIIFISKARIGSKAYSDKR
jgi:hypothetical protein